MDDDVTTMHPRVIYTNIRGLLIDHELIDAGDNQGLGDWHKWAKPGAVIVFDEFQRAWPPRPNGSKVPEEIQALDTHRHMGVDFILITQNVINTDRHVHGLVGRHLQQAGDGRGSLSGRGDHDVVDLARRGDRLDRSALRCDSGSLGIGSDLAKLVGLAANAVEFGPQTVDLGTGGPKVGIATLPEVPPVIAA